MAPVATPAALLVEDEVDTGIIVPARFLLPDGRGNAIIEMRRLAARPWLWSNG